ncbi:MAG: hypothetical protein WAK80_05620 [Candidatus Cybelea sp.]
MGTVRRVAAGPLIADGFVPIALIIVKGSLYNSYAFHITMLPIALAAPIGATILWLLVALQDRDTFAPVFRARPPFSIPKLRFLGGIRIQR